MTVKLFFRNEKMRIKGIVIVLFVAQLAEQALLTPVNLGSNPLIGYFYGIFIFFELYGIDEK